MTADFRLFLNALKDVLSSRRIFVALFLMVLPAIIGLIWKSAAGERFEALESYNTLAAGLVFGFILTILSVIYGTGVLSQELEGRTIVYLLTRPIPRWRILLAKYLGAWLAITVTVSISEVLLALAMFGTKLSGVPLMSDIKIIPLGAAAYGALFLLLATLLSKPLSYGLLFAFGWESWVPSLPGGFSRWSITTRASGAMSTRFDTRSRARSMPATARRRNVDAAQRACPCATRATPLCWLGAAKSASVICAAAKSR